MRTRLDQLFKDKLSNHAETTSTDAWARVEARLSKKNKRLVWFRMAAGLLLAGALLTTISWLSLRQPSSNSSQLSSKAASKKGETLHQATVGQPLNQKKQEVTTRRVIAKSNPVTIPIAKTENKEPARIERKNVVAQIETKVEEQPQQQVTMENITVVSDIQKIERSIVLEYRLETIETSLPATESASVVESKDKSGFQKVIDFARDAKNSDGPLANMRQAKDELFALNFKKDKQKNPK